VEVIKLVRQFVTSRTLSLVDKSCYSVDGSILQDLYARLWLWLCLGRSRLDGDSDSCSRHDVCLWPREQRRLSEARGMHRSVSSERENRIKAAKRERQRRKVRGITKRGKDWGE